MFVRGLCAAILLATGCLAIPQQPGIDGGGGDDGGGDADDGPCDGDDDGYLRAGCASDFPVDCADGDPAIHPGALDACGDVVDDDCIGGALPCDEAIRGNQITTPGGRYQVDNAHLRILFDDDSWAPIELAAVQGGNQNLLFNGLTTNERLMGVLHWDNWFSWRETDTTPTVETAGPAAVRLHIQWADGADPAPNPDFYGTSTYTIYPDGRIHRYESITVDTTASSNYLVAYTALQTARFTHVDWAGNTLPPHQLGLLDEELERLAESADRYLCAYHDTTGDRVGWSWRASNGGVGPRATESEFGSNHHLALQYDWYSGGAVPSQTSVNGGVMITVDGDGSRCDATPPIASAYDQPPTLTFTIPSGTISIIDAAAVFQAFNVGGSAEVEFTVNALLTAPPSTVLRIEEIDLETRAPTLCVDGEPLEHGRDYLLQVGGQYDWIFIGRPLDHGSVVRIATP